MCLSLLLDCEQEEGHALTIGSLNVLQGLGPVWAGHCPHLNPCTRAELNALEALDKGLLKERPLPLVPLMSSLILSLQNSPRHLLRGWEQTLKGREV